MAGEKNRDRDRQDRLDNRKDEKQNDRNAKISDKKDERLENRRDK